jgi:hypothetical protein
VNREVADLLARALADACAANDPAAAALAAYRVFTTPDASKALVRVCMVAARKPDADDQWTDRRVYAYGKVIGTRYLVDGTYHEHVDVRAAASYEHPHPSKQAVLELMRHGEIGSHYLLAEVDTTLRSE